MKNVILGILAVGFSISALAQSADLPSVQAGDTWTYRDTVEKGPNGWTQSQNDLTVSHTTSSSIYYTTQASGSTQTPKEAYAGSDWSRLRSVDSKETVVNKPFSFPLTPGKTWNVQYTEQHPNKIHTYEQIDDKYKVVGFETVEVPAGKFQAIKVEAEGQWTAEMAPVNTVVQGAQAAPNTTTMFTQVNKNSPVTATGRTYKAFWYVPETKRWVKSIEEYYGGNGVRNARYTEELTSFKVN